MDAKYTYKYSCLSSELQPRIDDEGNVELRLPAMFIPTKIIEELKRLEFRDSQIEEVVNVIATITALNCLSEHMLR